jgi:CheY-like chemotaxis protein
MRAGLATETRGLSTSPLRRAEEGETVLTVEDEPAVLSAVVESLADLGYFVLPAQNAAEALTCLRSNEKIDILFSDVNVRRSGQPLDC